MMDIEELATAAINCGIGVHRGLGPGLLESVYEVVMAKNLSKIGLSVERQVPVNFSYDGIDFDQGFRVDLLVEGRLVIEIKSVEKLAAVHLKQVQTYLRLIDQPLGLLMNFGGETLRDGLARVVNKHVQTGNSPLRIHRR
jgi:GxxExxY protein